MRKSKLGKSGTPSMENRGKFSNENERKFNENVLR